MVREISAYQFRNLSINKLKLAYPRVFILGNNAQGKSSLLEAIYYLSYGHTVIKNKEANCVAYDKDMFSLYGQYDSEDGSHELRMSWRAHESPKKKIYKNQKLMNNRDKKYFFPSILFSFYDLELSINTSFRRLFIDQCLSDWFDSYALRLNQYNKTLVKRNLTLKTDPSTAFSYEPILIREGLFLMGERYKIVDLFKPYFLEYFNLFDFVSDTLRFDYQASWESNDELAISKILEDKRKEDIQKGYTTCGPHRDHFEIYINDRPFHTVASMGQKRILAIIFKLIQLKFFYEYSQKSPILLLDDVLLELDKDKQEIFFAHLNHFSFSQAFFTFLPNFSYLDYQGADTLSIQLKEGKIN